MADKCTGLVWGTSACPERWPDVRGLWCAYCTAQVGDAPYPMHVPGNAAVLYAESVINLRTPQEYVIAIANAYDAGAHSRDAEIERLRSLIVAADSICSLILHREAWGLSEQTAIDLDHVVTDLRKAGN